MDGLLVLVIKIIASLLDRQPTAAAAAKSLQSCQTLGDPIDGSRHSSGFQFPSQTKLLPVFQPLDVFPPPRKLRPSPSPICNHSSFSSEFKCPPSVKSSLTFYFNSSLTKPLVFPNKTLIRLVSSIIQVQLHLATYQNFMLVSFYLYFICLSH